MKIAIVGYGIVGKNIHKEFPEAFPVDINDYPYEADIAFICVPTPKKENGECDVSCVENALARGGAKAYILKSTVPPGTTQRMINKFNVPIVFSPEYYGETVNANGYDYPFVILGGKKEHCRSVAELYKRRHTGHYRIFQTDSNTAELAKYMENAFLAAKVTFCNEFYRLAEKIGVDYNELRELWLLDPRIGRSHTYVFDDQPFYDTKCLNKDIPAIIAFAERHNVAMTLMKSVEMINDGYKEEYERT